MSLIKLPFLAITTLGIYTNFTPPQPKPDASLLAPNMTMFERAFSAVARLYMGSFKLLLCSGVVLEAAVIFAAKYPAVPISGAILKLLVHGPPSLAAKIGLSPAFLVGFSMVTLGSYTRYRCYRALGQFFTFEVTMSGNHRLITDGPYAYVRHPSYTSAVITGIGIGISLASAGSWFRECRVVDTMWGKATMVVYLAATLLGVGVAVLRPAAEDVLLKERFGPQWDAWAQKVQYRLIPYIY